MGRARTLFDLRERSALVVGGASGLGAAIACGLAANGARVVVADRDEAGAGELAEGLRERGAAAIATRLDVREEPTISTALDATVAWAGGVDIAFNLAAINDRRPALELSVADFQRVIDVNLIGTYACARLIGERMVAQGHGKLINVASIFGHVAASNQSAYAASKGAVIQLTRVLAHEWAPHNVQVNALSPAHIRTPLSAPVLDDPRTAEWVSGRILRGTAGETWEIMGPALFLASDASSFMTGGSLIVDGGWLAG
jgi:NAD(P)-dependent dehydrogenase (short-subunit alcohol dehydrogenase family)